MTARTITPPAAPVVPAPPEIDLPHGGDTPFVRIFSGSFFGPWSRTIWLDAGLITLEANMSRKILTYRVGPCLDVDQAELMTPENHRSVLKRLSIKPPDFKGFGPIGKVIRAVVEGGYGPVTAEMVAGAVAFAVRFTDGRWFIAGGDPPVARIFLSAAEGRPIMPHHARTP